jgi:CheY-like chemotaxis protein
VNTALLLVEDNEDDVFLMRRALTRAGLVNPLHVVSDGEQAVNYLGGGDRFRDRAAFPLPGLVFLDLKLPRKSGHDVLRWVRQQQALRSLVVVVLTSSDQPSDIAQSYRLGANSYLTKPPTVEQLLDLAKAFRLDWLEFRKLAPT